MSGFTRCSMQTLAQDNRTVRWVPDSSSLLLQTHLPLSSLLLWAFGPGDCTMASIQNRFPLLSSQLYLSTSSMWLLSPFAFQALDSNIFFFTVANLGQLHNPFWFHCTLPTPFINSLCQTLPQSLGLRVPSILYRDPDQVDSAIPFRGWVNWGGEG